MQEQAKKLVKSTEELTDAAEKEAKQLSGMKKVAADIQKAAEGIRQLDFGN